MELINGADVGGLHHLSMLSTFGAKWLIPRLLAFQLAHPQVALHFVPCVQGCEFYRADLDCSVLFGDGHWPRAGADRTTRQRGPTIAAPDTPKPGRSTRRSQASGNGFWPNASKFKKKPLRRNLRESLQLLKI